MSVPVLADQQELIYDWDGWGQRTSYCHHDLMRMGIIDDYFSSALFWSGGRVTLCEINLVAGKFSFLLCVKKKTMNIFIHGSH